MYDMFGTISAAFLTIFMFCVACVAASAALLGMSYDRIEFSIDVPKMMKKLFVAMLVAASFAICSIVMTVWFGWKEGVFDGRDKRTGGDPARVGSSYRRDRDRLQDLWRSKVDIRHRTRTRQV